MLKFKLEIISNFQVKNYIIGICPNAHIANTYFVGNNFGAIMPFLGFGQFSAILTGIYSAYDIMGKENYEKQLVPLRKSYLNSLTLRKFMEMSDNKNLDFLVKKLNKSWGNKIFNSNINYLQIISTLLKPYVKIFYSKKQPK